jgi:hypothetical protein
VFYDSKLVFEKLFNHIINLLIDSIFSSSFIILVFRSKVEVQCAKCDVRHSWQYTEAPRGLGATHMEVRSSHFALRTSTLDLSTGIIK